MEERLQRESEYKKLTVVMRDDRFNMFNGMNVRNSLARIIPCLLHMPMRINEKVLYLVYSKCYNGNEKKDVIKSFQRITDLLREMGRLGAGWDHQWNENDKDKLEKFALPLDQSRRIFNLSNYEKLCDVVNIAYEGNKKEKASHSKEFLTEYLHVLRLLSMAEYVENDYIELELHEDKAFRLYVEHIGGQEGVTNYFHLLGAGHISWLCRQCGPLYVSK